MRWDYVEKKKRQVEVKKSFISNGTYLYVVEHDNKQVVKKNLAAGPDAGRGVVPLRQGRPQGRVQRRARHQPSKYGAKADLVLKLTPKQPSAQYKNLYLVVNPTDFHVSQSVIIDSSNNVNHFRFFSPDFQKPIKDSWFEFDERACRTTA